MFTSVSDCNSSTKSQLTAACRTRVHYVAANTIVTPVSLPGKPCNSKTNTALMRKKVLAMTSICYAQHLQPEVVVSAHRRLLPEVLVSGHSLVHFLQFDEQSIYDGATSLVRRPLQLLVAELGVDLVRCSDRLLAHFVTFGIDQNFQCHLAVVSGARLLVFVPVIIKTLHLHPHECELRRATYSNHKIESWTNRGSFDV